MGHDKHKKKSSKKHKKKHGNRGRSPSNSSRSPSPSREGRSEGNSGSLVHQRILEELNAQKQKIKENETPEEKRIRRLKKKQLKEEKKKMLMGMDNDSYLGYNNTDNPFGDEKLLDTFVWKAKIEKEHGSMISERQAKDITRIKMIENKTEIERVRERRSEWEKRQEMINEEKESMQRQKEAEFHKEWEKQEDKFHLQQAKMRSELRLQDGRAKPIDMLAKYISSEGDTSVILHEPTVYLENLSLEDLEDLLEDIKVYTELEEGQNVAYWRDMILITREHLSEEKQKFDSSAISSGRDAISKTVSNEVSNQFKNKSVSQLAALEAQIKSKLDDKSTVDIGYWESVLEKLRAYAARARIKVLHEDMMKIKLAKLKEEAGFEGAIKPTTFPSYSGDMPPPEVPSKEEDDENEDKASESEEEELEDVGPLADDPIVMYESGRYTPPLVSEESLGIDTVVYTPEEVSAKIVYARDLVIKKGRSVDSLSDDFMRKATEGMGQDENQITSTADLGLQQFLWSDKYRPRKPRFFNRVHTGWEWNKYNQTHYDLDNPPPKIVQGYKFNLFYADLIDKTVAPTYTISEDPGSPDYCILRFKAGPPYEDIAFKIVNREWDTAHRYGFRCQFQNCVFQLWFKFRRMPYRR